jgi:hypothetical protein
MKFFWIFLCALFLGCSGVNSRRGEVLQTVPRPEPLVPAAELRVRLGQLRKDMSLKDINRILRVPLTSVFFSTTFCTYEYPFVILRRSSSGDAPEYVPPEYRLTVFTQFDAHWRETLREAVLSGSGETESWPK